MTPLHHACICHNFHEIRHLIGMGADITVQDDQMDTPLHYIISQFRETDNIANLEYLLNQPHVNFNQQGQNGCTLFHLVCGQISIFPLHIFAKCLQNGADIHIQDQFGHTPLDYVLSIFENGYDVEILKYLISQPGVDLNARGENGSTFFHCFCDRMSEFSLEMFKFVIETHGADVNIQDDHGRTPIHVALINIRSTKDIDIIKYLLDQDGVSINPSGPSNSTLFHAICEQIQSLSLDILAKLLDLGAGLHHKNIHGKTPLHYALTHFEEEFDAPKLQYLLTRSPPPLYSLLQASPTHYTYSLHFDDSLCKLIEFCIAQFVNEL